MFVILAAFGLHLLTQDDSEQRNITVGFVYVGDTSTAYTGNFVKVQQRIPVRIDLEDVSPEEMAQLRAGMMVETEALRK